MIFLARYWKLIGVGALVVALSVAVGVQRHTAAGLKTAQTALASTQGALRKEKDASAALRAALKLSEDKRAVEYSLAVADAGDAENACSARVAAAHRSANKIRSILEKSHAVENGCPVRAIVGAGELRDALQARP